MLTEQQIQDNYQRIINFIDNTFNGERRERLLKLYDTFSERVALSPASNRVNFHSCFVGGYVYHVLNVIEAGKKVSDLWSSFSGVKNYTDEELNFVTLNHDLGKIGNLDYEYYIPATDDWKIKKGTQFDFTEELPYMKTQDRSIFLLQHFGIKMTENEFVSIKLHDGLYDEGNKAYLVTYEPKYRLRSMLPYIAHWADMMAFKKEYYEWENSLDGQKFLKGINGDTYQKKVNKPKKTLEQSFKNAEPNALSIDDFNKIFGEFNNDKKMEE